MEVDVVVPASVAEELVALLLVPGLVALLAVLLVRDLVALLGLEELPQPAKDKATVAAAAASPV